MKSSTSSKKDTSALQLYLEKYEYLTPFEFEDFVAEVFRAKGWSNVYVTTRGNDKGRDVIGTDLNGNIAYIEVKREKNNIGRPVVQKLHSIMVTDQVSAGLIVSASDFTQGARKYAESTGISLINGAQLKMICDQLVEFNPLVSKFTVPYDKDQVSLENHNHLSNYIDFKPFSFRELLQNSEIVNFTLKPVEYITFSLAQDFLYRNKQNVYNMRYYNSTGLISPNFTRIFKESPFTQSLEDTISILKTLNINYTLEKLSGTREDIRSIKNRIRDNTSKKISYYGANNQHYTKPLTPSLRNITINKRGIVYLWNCDISTKFINKSEIKVRISDGKVNPAMSLKQNKVTCKVCQKFEDLLNRKICSFCNYNLCVKCVEERKIFRFFKRFYCPECTKSGIKKDKKRIILRSIFALGAAGLFFTISWFIFTLGQS